MSQIMKSWKVCLIMRNCYANPEYSSARLCCILLMLTSSVSGTCRPTWMNLTLFWECLWKQRVIASIDELPVHSPYFKVICVSFCRMLNRYLHQTRSFHHDFAKLAEMCQPMSLGITSKAYQLDWHDLWVQVDQYMSWQACVIHTDFVTDNPLKRASSYTSRGVEDRPSNEPMTATPHSGGEDARVQVDETSLSVSHGDYVDVRNGRDCVINRANRCPCPCILLTHCLCFWFWVLLECNEKPCNQVEHPLLIPVGTTLRA